MLGSKIQTVYHQPIGRPACILAAKHFVRLGGRLI